MVGITRKRGSRGRRRNRRSRTGRRVGRVSSRRRNNRRVGRRSSRRRRGGGSSTKDSHGIIEKVYAAYYKLLDDETTDNEIPKKIVEQMKAEIERMKNLAEKLNGKNEALSTYLEDEINKGKTSFMKDNN